MTIERKMKTGDLATWAGIAILVAGGLIGYGKLSQKVDDMDTRLGRIENGLQQRGIIAHNCTNEFAGQN